MTHIQYIVFPASEDTNLPYFTELLQTLTGAEGHISSFSGLQVEEEGSKNRYLVTVWESAEYAKEKFAELSSSSKNIGALIQREFTVVKGTPLSALEARTTELVIITPKDGVSFSQLKEFSLKVRDVWSENGHPSTISEGDGAIFSIVGWSSTADHFETIKKEPYASMVEEFGTIGIFDMEHANMKKHFCVSGA